MKINGFANYGVLANEKQPVFTIGDIPADCAVSDRVEFDIPDGWDIFEGATGDTVLENKNGDRWIANQVLESIHGEPYLSGVDGNGNSFKIKIAYKNYKNIEGE